MEKSILCKNRFKNDSDFLIFLCWLIYTVSYFGKLNYSANITGIIDYYNVTKAQAGLAPTFFFFAYGTGQIINGLLCKKYNIKKMIFLSLFLSATINLIIAICPVFSIVKWLWLINGFSLSVLWPTLIRLLSETLPEKDMGKSTVIMGTTVAAGTLIIYGLSSLYSLFADFRLSFYTAFFADIIVALLWIVLYKKCVNPANSERYNITGKKTKAKAIFSDEKNDNKLLYISIGVLCVCAIGVNLIKDGLVTWLPQILNEEYSLKSSLSILLTLFLPIVAVFGNWFALKTHNKLPDFVIHCSVIFVIMLVFMGIITGSLTGKNLIIMLTGLVIVNFLASSLNSLLTSIFPMFMRDKLNSGLFSGVLNGFCYVGSTISSYGLGIIADCYGWKMIFIFLMAISIAILIICMIYVYIKKIIKGNV